MRLTIAEVELLMHIAKDPPSYDKQFVVEELTTYAQEVGLGLINEPYMEIDEIKTLVKEFKEWAAKPRKPRK